MPNGLPMLQAAAERRAREQAANQPADAAFVNVDPQGNYIGNAEPLTKSETNNMAGAGRGGQGGPTAAELITAQAAAGSGRGTPGGPTAEQIISDQEQTAIKTKLDARPTAPIKGSPNPLFEAANYTYGISLHVLPIDMYNKIMSTPNYVYVPVDRNGAGTVLIASGGRRNDVNFKRNARFNEDFYFDNLKFTSVVGMNSRNKNANSIEYSFSIIEPYGVTLLNRLLGVADDLKANSWMQIPFMLQVDFFGNDSLGSPMHPIKNQTKYFPIRLIGCKIKVSTKGAEYQVSAIPFSHQAFSESNASTPANFEVQAATIKDFFSATGSAGDATGIMATITAANSKVTDTSGQDAHDRKFARESGKSLESSREAKDNASDNLKVPFQVGSFAAAMNSYQKQLVTNKHQSFAETYDFEFDTEILNSKIVIPKKLESKRVTMTPGVAAIRAQAGLSTAGVDSTTETFSINAGTNIIDVINLAMRNSDYIRKQLTDPATDVIPATGGQGLADKQNKPFNWYKIIPKIEIKDFDLDRNMYSKRITYYVQKYTYYNSKFKDAPTSQPDTVSKEYHYMYTGKNDSIISFDIDFDTMFYTTITADRSKIQKDKVQAENPGSQVDASAADKNQGPKVQDKQYKYITSDQTMPTTGSPDSKSVLVNDFAKSMLSSSRGDMINVKLKIIGDPEFLKQDDVFFNPANNPNQKDTKFTNRLNGSIVFDAAEIFALLTFRTPVDFDPVTGLANFGAGSTMSVFSGLYKVITVESTFNQGQFTQTLDMIRMFDQLAYDTPASKSTGNNDSAANRAKDPSTVAAGTAQAAAPAAIDQANLPTVPGDAVSKSDPPVAGAGQPRQGTKSAEQLSADTSYNQLESARLMKKSLADVPVTLAGDIDSSGNVVDMGLG